MLLLYKYVTIVLYGIVQYSTAVAFWCVCVCETLVSHSRTQCLCVCTGSHHAVAAWYSSHRTKNSGEVEPHATTTHFAVYCLHLQPIAESTFNDDVIYTTAFENT